MANTRDGSVLILDGYHPTIGDSPGSGFGAAAYHVASPVLS